MSTTTTTPRQALTNEVIGYEAVLACRNQDIQAHWTLDELMDLFFASAGYCEVGIEESDCILVLDRDYRLSDRHMAAAWRCFHAAVRPLTFLTRDLNNNDGDTPLTYRAYCWSTDMVGSQDPDDTFFIRQDLDRVAAEFPNKYKPACLRSA